MVEPVPIILGKAPGELISLSMVMLSNIAGKGESIPWHKGLGWQIQQFSYKFVFNKDFGHLLQIYDHHGNIMAYNMVKKMT